MEAFAADSNMSTDAAPPYSWSGTIAEVHQLACHNIIITDDLLREKAKKLGEQLDVPENFTYSSGWLQRFKGRFHISQRRLCGEGASISPAIIDEHLTNLNSMLANSGYDPTNIYIADETGLFFSAHS
ncbi:TIGD6 [Cordylochernes scorpioides]|uniref:TIGD6 n=1 Tax=Cordylochernes scorpioides TaxID=51811 RepID=A0ABY6LTI3_9ARAC|nr:TIGD6 [Cordylochernes scorpioides]